MCRVSLIFRKAQGTAGGKKSNCYSYGIFFSLKCTFLHFLKGFFKKLFLIFKIQSTLFKTINKYLLCK